MSDSEIIQMLSEIRDYLTAGNPVWDTAMVREAMNVAIFAVEIVEEKVKMENGDYIKREDALKIVNDMTENEDDYKRCYYTIKDLPSADVVEVVRCKDCRHFQQNVWGKVNGIEIIVGHEMCDFWGDGCKTKEEGYCSYGERK